MFNWFVCKLLILKICFIEIIYRIKEVKIILMLQFIYSLFKSLEKYLNLFIFIFTYLKLLSLMKIIILDGYYHFIKGERIK